MQVLGSCIYINLINRVDCLVTRRMVQLHPALLMDRHRDI